MSSSLRLCTGLFHPQALRLPSTLRVSILTSRPQLLPIRLTGKALDRAFLSSIERRHATPAQFPSASAGSFTTTDPVLRAVIKNREPILLYKEPPRAKRLWPIYICSVLFSGVGLGSVYFASTLPEDLAWFVAPTYLVMGVGFTAIALHLFQRPVRRIALLEVIPSTMGGRLQLRFTARKAPYSGETVFTADIWDATLSEKTAPVIVEILEANRARHQRISEGLENYSIIPRIWELAARWIEQKWTSFFLRFKFAVLQFPIVHIEVDGIKWKLDCTGYLREQGQAIDRIIAEE